jgi:UDP-N-acetyl-D-galactosamine dehydrogenase
MGTYIAERVVKLLTRKRIHVVDSRILILGLAFKENCPDLRNTRVVDVIRDLQDFSAQVDVYDPWVSKEDAKIEYNITLVDHPEPGTYDAVVLAVAHTQFKDLGIDTVRSFCKPQSIVFDVKYLFSDQPNVHCL